MTCTVTLLDSSRVKAGVVIFFWFWKSWVGKLVAVKTFRVLGSSADARMWTIHTGFGLKSARNIRVL